MSAHVASSLMPVSDRALTAASLVCLVILSGCGLSSEDDVAKWMEEQRASVKPTVRPIPEPKRFTPFGYSQAAAVEPFNQQKLAVALKQEVARSNTLVTPELNRRKEPLEAYPLDAIALVGSLNRSGKPSALVRADNLLYEVRVGNYMGQNFGRITKITETEMTLREIVQDAAGEWIERNAALQLQERK
jgi:type IV pilus assembly protein PilP